MRLLTFILFIVLIAGIVQAKVGFDLGTGFGSGDVTVSGAVVNSLLKEDGNNATKEAGTDWLVEG